MSRGVLVFEDRASAGALLARELEALRGRGDVVVLAVPRGGVPVGAALAAALGLPLDVALVKKVGHPADPECAVGAVSLAGEDVDAASRRSDIPAGWLAAEVARVREVLRRSSLLYRGHARPVPCAGRTVVLVDDGAATGRTLLTAVAVLRREGAARVLVAVPVASREALAALRRAADGVVCLLAPGDFEAVGRHYEDFRQVTDEQAAALLSAGGRTAGR